MTIDEQLEVISSFKQGRKVYVISKYGDLDKDWTLISDDHVFDFDKNRYSIDEPKLWIQTLCKETDMNIAMSQTIKHLDKCIKTINISMHDTKVDTQEAIFLKDIYKLWNIAVQYGRANSGSELELITEENNILKNM